MITGRIEQNKPLVTLKVIGPDGSSEEVEFILDTGFTGELTLPSIACHALRLTPKREVAGSLADGSQVLLQVYKATLLWDGTEREVDVVAADGRPLLGMTLLDGYDVHLCVTEGGSLTVEEIQRASA